MTSSTLLYSAAALMALSGILMAVSASPALGAVLLAAGACMAAAPKSSFRKEKPMTNSLTAIQKCARVFRVLVRVGLILSIAGAVFGLAALMLWIHWNNAPATGIPQLDQVMQLIDRGSYYHTLSTLIADVVGCAFGGALLWLFHRYLTHELADGTPFTFSGASELRRLGVVTIVLPLVGLCLQAIPYTVYDLSYPNRMENGTSVLLGVALILASLVFRYGAELTRSKEMI